MRIAHRERASESDVSFPGVVAFQGQRFQAKVQSNPIGSMDGIYANIWGILMVNVTIYGIHGSYGNGM